MAPADVTQLLIQLDNGDREAFDHLIALVYPSLQQIARAQLRGRRAGETVNTTGLVHEAYLKLVRYEDVTWKGRAHFFGAAAQTMRRILIDFARARLADKREGERVTVTLSGIESNISLERLIEIDDALERMNVIRPRWVKIVESRYFAGLSIQETAEVLGISHGTVSNDWRMARAWLLRELSE